jgi:hypothetical protein
MVRSLSWEQLGIAGSLGITAVISGINLTGRGVDPWLWACAVATGVAILGGPIRWLVRSRTSPDQHDRYEYAAIIGFAAAVPLVVAGLLLAGAIQYRSSILTLGGLLGYAVVVLYEETTIRERLDAIDQ